MSSTTDQIQSAHRPKLASTKNAPTLAVSPRAASTPCAEQTPTTELDVTAQTASEAIPWSDANDLNAPRTTIALTA
ncbi:unnamed protein product [Acanthoscelides obtectus]|uniref:Uncharacterized protein n=1 Tax=Acanthoscelides obtectus TaxID=200917 RepID=A0A9P0M1L6_ACAOB|nr:unnamed protein product [Acanthoscelides obtectus]CAK1619953.1 hypothetical protein AOBTE_LOCUS100 [Acanthoscelides obtectus]